MREVFSLDAVAEPERMHYWSAITRQVFWPFRMSIPLPSLAGASVTRSVSSVVELATVTAGSHTLHHTAADAASSPGDTLCLALQIAGESSVRQDKRSAVLRTGEALFFDPHRPYAMSFEDTFSLAVFSFPRALLSDASRHSDRITTQVLAPGPVRSSRPGAYDDPASGLAAAGAGAGTGAGGLGVSSGPGLSLGSAGGYPGPVSAPRGTDPAARSSVVASALAYFSFLTATFDADGMIADSLSGGALAIADTLARELVAGRPELAERDVLLERAIEFIDHHLSDPGLAPQAVADALHLSLRQLYRVFASADRTIADTIREQRLTRARSLLESLPPATPAQWVGARVGFASVEQFTRAFRAAYGLPPAAWRDAHLASRSAHLAKPDRLIGP